MADFPLEELELVHPACIIKIIQGKKLPKGGFIWPFTNEIKPVDLYCYLYARFGPPNGLQNFWRNDSSDNLIHWEWSFACDRGLVHIQGHNFRSELHCTGEFPEAEYSRDAVFQQFKADFAAHGKKMSQLRADVLEKWTQFINPFARIKLAVERLKGELDALSLSPDSVKHMSLFDFASAEGGQEAWKEMAGKYSTAVGLCFGIRSMLPVMAEAFVNLLLFVLVRPDIKGDKRLLDSVVRQPIDVRIRSLHINCQGFASAVDYTSEPCAKYHSIVNERNDLLHGNFAIEKLSFGTVHFNAKVPVFIEYPTFWDRSFGVELAAVGFDRIEEELGTIESFIEYLLSLLQPSVREHIETIMAKRDLGLNAKTGRIGVLFPDTLVDMRMGPKPEAETSGGDG